MEEITWNDFKRIKLVVGTVTSAQIFSKARQPAYIIHADFGSEFGILKSSAQVTGRYLPEDLIGRQIIGVLNFPPKQIGPIKSQFLLTGFTCEDGTVVLARPDQQVTNGLQLE